MKSQVNVSLSLLLVCLCCLYAVNALPAHFRDYEENDDQFLALSTVPKSRVRRSPNVAVAVPAPPHMKRKHSRPIDDDEVGAETVQGEIIYQNYRGSPDMRNRRNYETDNSKRGFGNTESGMGMWRFRDWDAMENRRRGGDSQHDKEIVFDQMMME